MFLVLGTPDCKYCLNAKEELAKAREPYLYLDLKTLYGEGWRAVFTDIKEIINGQRTIPIIFTLKSDQEAEGAGAEPVLPNEKLTVENMQAWEYLGVYPVLLDLLEEKARNSISLDENY